MAEFGQHLSEVKNIKVIGVPPNCKIVYAVHKTKDFVDKARKEKTLADREKEKEQFEKSMAARIEKERELVERK